MFTTKKLPRSLDLGVRPATGECFVVDDPVECSYQVWRLVHLVSLWVVSRVLEYVSADVVGRSPFEFAALR